MRSHRSGHVHHFNGRLFTGTLIAGAAVIACAFTAVVPAGATEQPRMPNFISSGQVPVLRADRGSSAAADEELMRVAGETQRRAEEERLKAVEIRRQAEALSQRFAVEMVASQTKPAATAKPQAAKVVPSDITTGAIALAPAAPVTATVRAEQAEAELMAAREALTRARAELDEATRRAQEVAEPRVAAQANKTAAIEKPAEAKEPAGKRGKASAHKAVQPETGRKPNLVATAQPQPVQPAKADAAGSAIAEPSMGPTSEGVTASAAANPIAGLLSKVFGGGNSDPPVASFNGQ